MRKLTVIFTLALLVTPLIATAQEDDIAQYANLDQLGHVIEAFVAGDEVDGVIFDAAEEASDVIIRQFQITTNLVSGPTPNRDEIDFVPVGFTDGSTTEIENLEQYFDGTIGENDIIPPLAPNSRDDDGIDVSSLFEGWTAYGDRGELDFPIYVLPNIKTIWGLELAEPIEGNCPERRYFGRSWVSQGVGGTPDPLFTAEGLANSYNDDSHQLLAGSGGRLMEFFCTDQGSVAWAQRMKDDGDVRSFGPTGVIALVKDRYIVFFTQVGVLDGRLDQFFYASPVDGGPVVVSEVESEPLLLLPNPYEAYPTRISIIVDGDEQASGDIPRHLLYEGSTASGVKIQTGGGCTLADREFFTIAVLGAINSGYARNSSAGVETEVVGEEFVFTTTQPSGSTETVTINLRTGGVEFETSNGCAGTGIALVNGEPIGDGAATDDNRENAEGSDDDSTSEAGEESDTSQKDEDSSIPWGPIALATALVTAVTAYGVNRNRTKKDCKPEEQALDAATRAASLAHKAAAEKEAAVQEAIMNDATKESTAKARAEADRAHAAAETAMDTYRLARAAYQACKGGADIGDEMDPSGLGVGKTRTRADTPEAEPEPEDGGTPIPPAGPDVLSDPPDETDPDEGCREGNEKVLPDPSIPTKTFTVPIGNIVVRGRRMRSWTRAMGGGSGLTPSAFGDLTEGDLEEALADFDGQSKVVRIHPEIPIAVYTVECGYVHRCNQNGEWVKTDEIGQFKTTRTVSSLSIGGIKDSPTKETAVKHVQEAQKKLAELLEEKDAYENFECG